MYEELKYLGKPEFVKVEDEVGEQFPCKMIWLDSTRHAYVTGGWYMFCVKNSVKENYHIVIGADQRDLT